MIQAAALAMVLRSEFAEALAMSQQVRVRWSVWEWLKIMVKRLLISAAIIASFLAVLWFAR
jgi:hypothetical protein